MTGISLYRLGVHREFNPVISAAYQTGDFTPAVMWSIGMFFAIWYVVANWSKCDITGKLKRESITLRYTAWLIVPVYTYTTSINWMFVLNGWGSAPLHDGFVLAIELLVGWR